MSNPNIEPVEVALLQRNASLPEPQRVLSRFVDFYKASLQREQEMLIKQETASDLLASEDALDDVADLASLAAAAEEGGLVPSEGEGVGPAAFEALDGLGGGTDLEADLGDSGVGDDPGAFFADLGGEPLDPPAEPEFGEPAAGETPDDFFAEIAAAPSEGLEDRSAEAAASDASESGASDESLESGFEVAAGEPGDLLGDNGGDLGGEPLPDGADESFYDQPTPVPSGVVGAPDDVEIAALADDGSALEAAEASPLELAAAAEESLSPLELAAAAELAAAEESAAVEEVPIEEPPKKKSKKKSKKKKK